MNSYISLVLLLSAGVISAAENNPLPVNWQPLPEPYATSSAMNPPNMSQRPAGATLTVPEGFTVEEYLNGFSGPRKMIHGGDDVFLLSDMDAGIVYWIQAKDKKKLITGLRQPYGLAVHEQWLYVADAAAVHRYRYDAVTAKVSDEESIIDLSAYASGHITRSILIDSEAKKLYLSIGSASNVSAGEPEARAAITRYNLDGSGYELFASGIRNAVGMSWNPVDQELWVTSHERDGLGDDLVPDYFTRVKAGDFYGWPYAYIGPHEDPRRKGEAPELVQQSLYPSVLLGGHVGAMEILFQQYANFPEAYREGAFIALHGSWNRSERSGYSVVFVPFQGGKAQAGPQAFLDGWIVKDSRRKVWGRPVGLLQMQDGSILVSDDGAGKIWRIHYEGR